MPRGNGTGPEGSGPMTGRGAGFCAGNGAGRGTANGGFGFGAGFRGGRGRHGGFRGQGRGFGSGFGFAGDLPASELSADQARTTEANILKRRSAILTSELEAIGKRVAELENGNTGT